MTENVCEKADALPSRDREGAVDAVGTGPLPHGRGSERGSHTRSEKGLFGAGCFWGVEATFRRVEGVVDVAVGYTGGTLDNPSYDDVCTGRTGHAEVVEVVFDPSVVSYDHLLEVFWNNHNPATLNRQGPDTGTQYRSAIFFHSADQEAAAGASKERLEASGRFNDPIVTEIAPSSTFYRAEEYHQRYLEKQGRDSCTV